MSGNLELGLSASGFDGSRVDRRLVRASCWLLFGAVFGSWRVMRDVPGTGPGHGEAAKSDRKGEGKRDDKDRDVSQGQRVWTLDEEPTSEKSFNGLTRVGARGLQMTTSRQCRKCRQSEREMQES